MNRTYGQGWSQQSSVVEHALSIYKTPGLIVCTTAGENTTQKSRATRKSVCTQSTGGNKL